MIHDVSIASSHNAEVTGSLPKIPLQQLYYHCPRQLPPQTFSKKILSNKQVPGFKQQNDEF
jgi:hypothetical protein